MVAGVGVGEEAGKVEVGEGGKVEGKVGERMEVVDLQTKVRGCQKGGVL